MSGEAVRWARDQMTGVRGGPYLLLFILAAMHQGKPIREPLHELARVTHESITTVRRHLDYLTQIGAVTYEPGGRGTGVRGSVVLHLDLAITPATLPDRLSRVRPLQAARVSRLEALRRGNDTLRVSGLEPYTPPDPPIRNKHYSNGKRSELNSLPSTPRESVFAELVQLQAGDLTPDDLSPRATAVFGALPTTDDRWSLNALSEAWIRTEQRDE
jgi:hypothetical protein